MGYDIRVTKDGEVCHAGENLPYEGSNVCIGGTDRMSITITYNYRGLLRETLGGDGVRDLDGCNVKCTVQKLKDAIEKLSGMDDAPWIEKKRRKLDEAISRLTDESLGSPEEWSDSLAKSYMRDLEHVGESYWTEKPSNVRKALEGMLWMAEKAPDGATWGID
jgi:hypothetical protein